MKRDLALATKNVTIAMRAVPYSVSAEKAAINRVTVIEETLAFVEKILKERF
jgi:hypothetical protein